MNITSPSQPSTAFQSSLLIGSGNDLAFNESAMIKSLQAMKSVMLNRYKLDPNRSSSTTQRFHITSHENYQELLNLTDYLDWLSKNLKNILVYESC